MNLTPQMDPITGSKPGGRPMKKKTKQIKASGKKFSAVKIFAIKILYLFGWGGEVRVGQLF